MAKEIAWVQHHLLGRADERGPTHQAPSIRQDNRGATEPAPEVHYHAARRFALPQQTALAARRVPTENIVEWAERMAGNLDDLSHESRREVLELLTDAVNIDGENNLQITLAEPMDEFVSIRITGIRISVIQ